MRGAWLVVVVLGCHSPDECERGLARLVRIDVARGLGSTPARWTGEILERCRKDPHYDPVLGCAIDANSDLQADACIDAFMKAVVKPAAATDGQGYNPLLQPSGLP
ncbi:MAG: hypothetical protein ABI591_03125 [Kofleriaceae bacterium]